MPGHQSTAARFRRSSYCGDNHCVEVASLPGGTILIRDTKNPDAPHLSFTGTEWDAFVAGVRAGEFSRTSLSA